MATTALIWVPIAETVIVLIVTCCLIYKYADIKRTNNISLAMTTLSWFLAFSMIFFIPLDIYTVSPPSSTTVKLLPRLPWSRDLTQASNHAIE